ncbi:Gfo/Idh/MocA family protein [Neorhodopirellula pilleata]|uniref:Gfo/Idh/MocA family protein n=1 Tax=Neorhodopirellula pilleata TaxID=2714738 RepID=UPI0011B45236|nr:Gfo/Idh/MocA family oxidoreductase [Neorhodopirellula pilleata]
MAAHVQSAGRQHEAGRHNVPGRINEALVGVGNRRGFFAKSSMAIAGGAVLAAEQTIARAAHAFGSDTLRVGLIGCGARGKAAAIEALQTNHLLDSGRVELFAMADAFGNQLQSAYRAINSRQSGFVNVGDRRFVGLTAWRQLLATDIDLVILAAPPVFRADQFSAAIEAGKHVMMESHVAIDQNGLEKIQAAAIAARNQRLAVASGLQRRHEVRSQQTIEQLRIGKIGRLVSANLYASQIGLPPSAERNQTRSGDFELKHWMHFRWAGGDVIDHRLLHSLDVVNWAFGATPIYAESEDQAIRYTYSDGRIALASYGGDHSQRRGMGELLEGSLGSCDFARGLIRDAAGKIVWQSDAKEIAGKGWQGQFNAFISAIRSGQPLDETDLAIQSTSSWLVGRESLLAVAAHS